MKTNTSILEEKHVNDEATKDDEDRHVNQSNSTVLPELTTFTPTTTFLAVTTAENITTNYNIMNDDDRGINHEQSNSLIKSRMTAFEYGGVAQLTIKITTRMLSLALE